MPRYFFKFETEEIQYEDPRRGMRSSNGYETALTIESMRANLRGKYLDDWLRAEREVEEHAILEKHGRIGAKLVATALFHARTQCDLMASVAQLVG